METAEQLLHHLKEVGDTISTIIRNFSKDSASRKTPTYYQERLSRLNSAWAEFDSADTKLRELQGIDPTDEYFTSEFYNRIQATTSKYRTLMESELMKYDPTQQGQGAIAKETPKQSTKADAPFTKETSISLSTGDNPQTKNVHNGLISRALGKMAALQRQLDGLHLQPGQDPSYYEIKRATITQLWQQLEQLNDDILDKYPNTESAGYDSRRYVRLEEEAQSAIIKLTAVNQGDQSSTPIVQPARLPLPTIAITKFDGDYMKWTSFADLFKQIVHKQPMSDAHKMWYLKTNVIGEASGLITHLAVTEENYQAAWQLLQDRYNNKRVMVATAIQRLLDQPSGAFSLGAIKRLHDTTKECLVALYNMGLQTSQWDPLLVHLLVKKLEKTVHNQYEQSISNPKELQSLNQFLAFLENYFHTLEAMGHKEKTSFSNNKTCALTAQNQHETRRCINCKRDSHPLYRCKEFLGLKPTNRLNIAQNHKLCVNCFSPNHSTKQCTTSGRCQKCGKKHHTLVHLELNPLTHVASSRGNQYATKTSATPKNALQPRTHLPPLNSESTENATSLIAAPKIKAEGLTASSTRKIPYVLLGTALIKVIANGLEIECKAILDSGSQVNLITERLVSRLGLSARSSSISINGIGQNKTKVQHRVNIELQSRINNFSARLEAFVLPQIITPQPAQLLHIDKWSIPNNIALADPTFNRPSKIDILLGAEYYHQLLAIGQIKLDNGLPVLQNTTFGWIVSGKVSNGQLPTATCGICSEDENITTAIERFWKLEEIENTQLQLSPHDAQCESHFSQNTRRNENGRFIVRLPFCNNTSCLGDSHGIAFNRFLSLERRLSKDSSLKDQYVQFMNDYEALGHMTKTNITEIENTKYFIPHHSVLRPDSSTTKLRVVFDASSKTSSGISLNDILHIGPPLQNELFTILLRFRMPRFVFTTDVEKMYRQIMIHPDDRQFQLIMWRTNISEPISYFKLNTVTYGTRPAPYLAIKCLKEISKAVKGQFELAATFLNNNFYVDDGLGGADNLTTAIETQRQLQHVMAMYGFNLRKWCANHPQLLQNIPEHDQELNLDLSTDDSDFTKTLGLSWLPKRDMLKIKVNLQPIKAVTKRSVTSDLARIFDPLGILSPVVVKAKMFIQELWMLNLSWDEAVPAEFDSRWRRFRANLKELESFQIHRHIYKGQTPSNTQLHVFSDASEKAYGASIYVRAFLPNKTLIVYLLCAKTRIAPLKKQTLPRLELCAAQLGTTLASKVKGSLGMESTPTFYWSDSNIVLTWIHSRSSSLNTFVANRIASIHETTLPEQWRHVKSQDNPADIISRGLDPQQLQQTPHWLYGPFFLHGNEDHWPPTFTRSSDMKILEQKQKRHTLLVSSQDENPLHYINHRNSFKTLQRIIGYVCRFIKHARTQRNDRQFQRALTPFELHDSLLIIVKITQRFAFAEDIKQLQKQKEVQGSSLLKSLSPFLDENSILRVGGRLDESTLPFDTKHPMLLPYNEIITRLIFEEKHKENKHCGAQALLANIRQRFWPIKGKHLARETIHKCVFCVKSKPKLLQQIMGNLPATRVTPARPFINAGVDYCGPIWVHFKIRGKQPQKAYIAVFCCFATKAVHLELVTSLTTEAFIGALKRFISRRGHCQQLYCDNATNFVGARNQLAELSTSVFSNTAQETIQKECASKNITFHFIPPRTPHFGGLWEAAVKSTKRLLIKELASASLTYEEMETLVIEVEAILNSRPLTALSADPNDVAALTPGHFLIGEPLTAQVDATAQSLSPSLVKRWELVSQLKHKFWKRWSHEYLTELQQRNKWQSRFHSLQIGTIVVIKDSTPVMTWRLGRVIETYPGADGIVRTATVKTSTGIIKRAIHLLAPLPLDMPTSPNINKGTDINPLLKEKPEASNLGSASKRHQASTDNIKGSPLPKRYSSATSSLILIFAILVPLVTCQNITYTQINSSPGLHFEQIGQIKPIISEWKLLVYFELAPFLTELELLTNGTDTLMKFCKDSDLNLQCIGLVTHFKHIKDRIETNFESLFRRKKRGAIDFVGNVANSLFGVLDSQYAEKMTNTINSIKNNEIHLTHLLRNQTSFLDSTLNIMKQNEVHTQTTLEKFNLRLQRLEHTTINYTHQSQLLLSLSIQLIIISDNVQSMLKAMMNLVTDTYHGRISPSLLTPQQFAAEFDNIRANLPVYLTLPVADIIHLYGIVKTHTATSSQHIICSLVIPLSHKEEFDLFYITPVPQVVNDSLVAIMSTTKMIALNAHRDEYFPIADTNLRDCNILEHDTFLCPHIQAIHSKGSPMCRCEIHLFNNDSDSSCNPELITDTNVWYKLHKNNQWLLATLHSLKLSTVCNGESSYHLLEGTGLLTLPAGCTMKNQMITIFGHKTIMSTIHPSYTSSGVKVPRLKMKVFNLTQTIQNPETIESIARLEAEVREQMRNIPTSTNNQDVHGLTVGYGGLALILAIIVIMSVKHFRKRKLHSPPEVPTPQPRQRSNWNLPVEP